MTVSMYAVNPFQEVNIHLYSWAGSTIHFRLSSHVGIGNVSTTEGRFLVALKCAAVHLETQVQSTP